MQTSKIKIGEQYHIDRDAVSIPYGAYRNGDGALRPTTVKIIEKGIQRPGFVRADGVKVEMSVEQYDPIMRWIDERVQRRETPEEKMAERDRWRRAYPRQWIISSRKVEEGVAAREKRIEEEQRKALEAEAWREYEMREKAGKITLATVGEMITDSEREVKRAARKLKSELADVILRAQEQIEQIDAATNNEGYQIELAEGQDEWPALTWYLPRAIRDASTATKEYEKAQKRHSNWMDMVKG